MRLNLFKRFSAPAVLLTAAWLIVADNGPFWRLISSVSASWDEPNPWFLASIFIVCLMLVNLTLTLLTYGRTTRYVLFLLLCVSAAAAYFMNEYGIVLNQGMIENIFETDRVEAMELLDTGLVIHTFVFGVLPALLIWRLVPARRSVRAILTEKGAVLGLSLLVAAVVTVPYIKDYASLVRNNRQVRYLLTPTNYLQSMYTYAVDLNAVPAVTTSIGQDAHKGPLWGGTNRKTLTVLVVGETARAANFSLGSYPRDTNPRLAKEQVIYFSNVVACGTSTRASLPCMFSDLTHADYSRDAARNREDLLDVLNHAGIRTLWLDNNSGCKGVCDDSPTWEPTASEASSQCVDGECFDMVMLDELKKAISGSQEDTVIVLHQNGSHGPSYYRRYPDEFRKFKPECRSDTFSDCTSEEIVNSYDNTIYYTDYFLSKVIELLGGYAEQFNTAMVYVSDHGESLGEYGLYLHGAPYFMAPDTQTHVPMLLWMSAGYQRDFRIDRSCLQEQRASEISHDYLFHSILGLTNIETSVRDKKLDLFANCTRAAPVFATEGQASAVDDAQVGAGDAYNVAGSELAL